VEGLSRKIKGKVEVEGRKANWTLQIYSTISVTIKESLNICAKTTLIFKLKREIVS